VKGLRDNGCSRFFIFATLLGLVSWQAAAYDPSPLQDFCVADMKSPVQVNGFPCKDPMAVNPDDFFNPAMLDQPRDTMKSKVGSNVTNINVINFPGLNTLGISLARIDYGPLGVNTPHIHPRATELLTVLEGTLYLGFVTSNPNRLFSKVVKKGDVFVFPKAMIHFQMNLAHDKPAAALSSLSSQNPGVITIANAVFGSKPPISDDVLATAFQVEKDLIHWLQSQFWENNNY
jgi:quercetin dioxygenase-like cupin family protein